MKKENKGIKPFLWILTLFAMVSANAQKVKIQQNSFHAPVNLKIDGKITEWGDKLQAYNTSTQVYYTIANDSNNLYLAVKVTDAGVINKIIAGGITLTISRSNQKKDENSIAFTLPFFQKNQDRPSLNLSNRPTPTRDTTQSRRQIDSFVNDCNQQLLKTLKLIGVAGIDTISDGYISIYNSEGIKAVSAIDKQIHYNYELAIPLKLLGLDISKTSKLTYNIKLKGVSLPGSSVMESPARPGILTFIGNDGTSYVLGNATPAMYNLYTPTDFWGEYTLAK